MLTPSYPGSDCECVAHELFNKLNGSSRQGDFRLAKQLVSEAESRHRAIGLKTLSSVFGIGGGYFVAITTKFDISLPYANIGLTGDAPIVVGKPYQSLVAAFVVDAQYAIFDDARYAAGRQFRDIVALGLYYSTMVDMFKSVVVSCRTSGENANFIVEKVRGCAWRIVDGYDAVDETSEASQFIFDLICRQYCLAA